MSPTDYPDYNEQSASAVVLASTDLTATGLAKESGGNLANVSNSTFGMGNNLAGVTAGALISAPGLTVSSDMKHANTGVTTEIAALIASGSPSGTPGGVPLLVGGVQLDQKTSITVNTGVQVFPSATTYYAINQIGYDGTIAVSTTAGPVYLRVIMQWFEGTTLIDNQTWYLIAGVSSGTQHSVYIKGPTRGSRLQLTLETNTGSAFVSFTLLQNSRVYRRDEWITSAFGVQGGNPAAGDPANGVLASVATGSIGAGGNSATYDLPLWSGRAWLSLQAESGSSAGDVVITDPDVALSSSSTVFAGHFLASQDTAQELILPRSNCRLVVHNSGSSAFSPTFALVADL